MLQFILFDTLKSSLTLCKSIRKRVKKKNQWLWVFVCVNVDVYISWPVESSWPFFFFLVFPHTTYLCVHNTMTNTRRLIHAHIWVHYTHPFGFPGDPRESVARESRGTLTRCVEFSRAGANTDRDCEHRIVVGQKRLPWKCSMAPWSRMNPWALSRVAHWTLYSGLSAYVYKYTHTYTHGYIHLYNLHKHIPYVKGEDILSANVWDS